MRLRRLVILVFFVAMVFVFWNIVRNGIGFDFSTNAAVRPVPAGDQEIAWIENATSGAAWPVLLLTTATAEKMELPGEDAPRDLMSLYPDRTFRFCFTNAQMAEAVIDFLADREMFAAGTGPDYYVAWKDDAYTLDLANR